jgi:hypothetical protein
MLASVVALIDLRRGWLAPPFVRRVGVYEAQAGVVDGGGPDGGDAGDERGAGVREKAQYSCTDGIRTVIVDKKIANQLEGSEGVTCTRIR